MILSSNNILNKMEVINRTLTEYIIPEHKLLYLNILYFLSIKTGIVHFNTEADFRSFTKLVDYCSKANISVEKYVVCFFKFCDKYLLNGHKVKLSYLLNEKVISYCGNNIKTALIDYTLLETIKLDILYTEKSIREYSFEHKISYNKSLLLAHKSGSLSEVFLLYKYYMGDELFDGIELTYTKGILLKCLEPFFLYITSRNGVFSKKIISSWNNSKIEDFNFCPVFFKDRYLTKDIDYPELMSNEASLAGTSVHNAFEELVNKYIKSKNKDLNKSYQRFLQSKTFKQLEVDFPEHIPGFVEFFTKTLPKLITKNTVIYTEKLMSIEYKGYNLYGTADLILINDGEATLIDYKTSKIDNSFWLDKNNIKYSNQLSLYAKFMCKSIQEISSVKDAYIVYTRGLIHKIEPLSETILDTFVEKIEKVKQHIKLKSFPANTKSCFLCRNPQCEFREKPSIWDNNGKRIIK